MAGALIECKCSDRRIDGILADPSGSYAGYHRGGFSVTIKRPVGDLPHPLRRLILMPHCPNSAAPNVGGSGLSFARSLIGLAI
jgi:hypothetical protein